MKTLSYFLLPGLLLAASCHKKDADPAPSPTRTTLLTAHDWKETDESLVINGYEGTRTISNTSAYTFAADGKLLNTSNGVAKQLGTWQLASNDTQLILKSTNSSDPAITYQLFDLNESKCSFGDSYDEAAIKQQVAAGGSQPVPALLLSAGTYTFPANMPTFQPSQVKSLQLRHSLGPK